MGADKSGSSPASMRRSAGIVGIAVLGSRLLGLLREKVIAFYFPAGVSGDAIYAAFRIPNLLRDLFAEGVLSKAFISVFTSAEVEDGEAAAWRLVDRTLSFFGVLLSAITLAGIYFAPAIVGAMFPGAGFDAAIDPTAHFGFETKRELTVFLARIMFPFLMLVSFAAVAMGVLNSRNIFGIPAWASSFFNVVSMGVGIAGYYLAPGIGLHPATGMAVGFLAGGLAQFTVQLPPMYRLGFRFRIRFDFSNPRLRQVLLLMGPAVIGAAALQLNVFANSIFASQGERWLTWISRAFRLMHLPIGLFGVAVSTVALPNLARLLANGEEERFRQTFSNALMLVIALTVPSAAGLMVLAEPICRLIFEGGAAGSLDTTQTARALFFYAIGLCGYAAVKIATDGFFALKDTKTPVRVSFMAVALNIGLNYVLIFRFGFDHTAMAISTAASVTLNVALLLVLFRRRSGPLGLRDRTKTIYGVVIATAVTAATAWAGKLAIEDVMGTETILARFMDVFVPAGLGALAFFLSAKLLKVPEVEQIWLAVRARLPGASK